MEYLKIYHLQYYNTTLFNWLSTILAIWYCKGLANCCGSCLLANLCFRPFWARFYVLNMVESIANSTALVYFGFSLSLPNKHVWDYRIVRYSVCQPTYNRNLLYTFYEVIISMNGLLFVQNYTFNVEVKDKQLCEQCYNILHCVQL